MEVFFSQSKGCLLFFVLTLLNFKTFHSFSINKVVPLGIKSSLSRSSLPRPNVFYSTSTDSPKTKRAAPENIMTLSRFMIEATRSNPDHADFESLMASIQIACKTIANLVSRAGISDFTGLQASSKTFDSGTPDLGDQDLSVSLYEMANNILKNSLRFTGKIGVVAPTEDGDQPLLVEEAWNSKYVAVFDALDGASNIDVGICVCLI